MSCISAHDPQLERLADAIAQRVGPQRFHVWFNNSTRLDLRQDGLEIAVPNDFISEWIGTHFSRPIQEAAHEVLGCSLQVKFSVMPQLFEVDTTDGKSGGGASSSASTSSRRNPGAEMLPVNAATSAMQSRAGLPGAANGAKASVANGAMNGASRSSVSVDVALETINAVAASGAILNNVDGLHASRSASKPANLAERELATPVRMRLRHDLESFVVGPSNGLAHSTVLSVAEYPGVKNNPLFIHGSCGLGKTHLLQGLCRRFIQHHPTKRWSYLTGEEFTNEFLTALKHNKLDVFRRRMRELDLLVIDDVHFLGGKRATQDEFLHTFNAIEALGKQVVMASDNHPQKIEEFGESLVNRFVGGMVVRIDPPNFATRCEILRNLAARLGMTLSEPLIEWVARRVTQNVRELEGAITRISAFVKMTGSVPDMASAQEALGDLDRQHHAPVRPENVLQSVCNYFGLENKDLMSGRRQRTISLARSLAMYLVRKTAKLSFPEIGNRMGKRNHSTVISACRRIERAVQKNEPLVWTSSVGEHSEEACELLQRLEEHSRSMV